MTESIIEGTREILLRYNIGKFLGYYELETMDLGFNSQEGIVESDGVPIGKRLFSYLCNQDNVARLISTKIKLEEIVNNLLEENHVDIEKLLTAHIAFEILSLDRVLYFPEIPNELLVTRNGDSSYLRFRRFSLVHQAYQLYKILPTTEKGLFYSKFDDDWYMKSTLGKCKFYTVITEPHRFIPFIYAKTNPLKFEAFEEIEDELKDLNAMIRENRKRANLSYKTHIRENPGMRHYFEFVGNAVEYNESIKLLRSSVIYSFIQHCRQNNKNMVAEFYNFMDKNAN